MSAINKFAVLREYPFLSQYCDTTRLRDAYVKRFDEEVLSLRVCRVKAHTTAAGKYEYDKHGSSYLLNEYGNLLARSGSGLPVSFLKPKTWFRPYSAWTLPNVYYQPEETIGDTFHHLWSEAQAVCYVVDIFDEVLTLYKQPKGFKTIGDWLFARAEEMKGRLPKPSRQQKEET